MLQEGWAFARDDAPSLYRALERMARSREIGIWRDAAVDLR
jgi:endonuclease YncB( thermonuclease family)